MFKRLITFAIAIYAVQSIGLNIEQTTETTQNSTEDATTAAASDLCKDKSDDFICDALKVAADELKGPPSREDVRNAMSVEMRNYMNESADPCEDFHNFACGNWRKHHPLRSGSYSTQAAIEVFRDFNLKIYLQLNNTLGDGADTESERKVKQFFRSCINLPLHVGDYSDKLKELANEFGQMPALVAADEWQEDDFDWLTTVAEIAHKYGINIILGYEIEADFNDHSSHRLILTNQKFKNTTKSELSLKYYIYASLFFNFTYEYSEQVGSEIADFEMKLWNASLSPNSDYVKKSTVQEIHDQYAPGLDIMKLTNITFGSIPTGPVYEDNTYYMEQISDIINGTPKKVVANYLALHVVRHFWENTPGRLEEVAEQCVEVIKKFFPKVVSRIFYRAYHLEEKEQYLENLWPNIKLNLQMILESSRLSWYDDDSRENALEKLHSVKMIVPTYKDNNFDEEYKDLTTNASDYLENLKSLQTLRAIESRATLNVAPHQWDSESFFDSPFYLSTSNTITIPISVLHSDVVSPLHPNALNYAHLGFDLGHEVIHGFNSNGRSFNRLGNYIGEGDQDIEDEYKRRWTCLNDQYHNYTYGGVALPQEDDQEENVADNVGIYLAYQSYRRWYEDGARTKEEIEMETLPNLSYNNMQLFFIYYSQMWCAYVKEDERAEMAAADVHSPDSIRAFVPLTNLDAFSTEFKCPKGSPMNPTKKCQIY